ncbi:MAG: hypothetical protein RL363_1535 [Bacteroidota bacterium]|jgi:lipid-binding SYLF domain-containing protein
MKFNLSFLIKGSFLLLLLFNFNASANLNQTRKDKKIIADCIDAKAAFISSDGLMKNLFNNAYSYAIFPNIGKGGFGIGGATGNGAVYRRGVLIGMAKMTQLTIGFQAGGQAYREVIFFENERVLNEFTDSKFEFSAQASAIIAAEGAAANVKYNNGVMIFAQPKGGLMYEASIGGQKFTYKAL